MRTARSIGRVTFILLLAFLLYLTWTAHRIAALSRVDETRPADAIIVFGAAEYSGKPSPIFRSRLDHALDLYRRGIAPVVITTGGAGGDPVFSEGEVGREYLKSKGVPEKALIAETQSVDTAQSAERVAVIMGKNGMRSCVTVSDGYHLFRIKHMMLKQGVAAFGSPRAEAKIASWPSRVLTYYKEALSYLIYRAFGT